MTKAQTYYLIAIIVGLIAAILSYNVPIFPYTPDSASYIEQARSLLERGVFESAPLDLENPSELFIPDKLFPSGYPILIAAFSKLLQLSTELVAPFICLACLGLLPSCIIFSFRNSLGLEKSLLIGMLVAFAPIIIWGGGIAASDVIAMLVAIFSVGLILNANDRLFLFFLAGIFSAFAYLVRNSNLALLLSVLLFMLWLIAAESENRSKNIKIAFIWLFGCALLLAPWIIRNLIVFGKIQPYSMPPSSVSLIQNIRLFIRAQLDTLLSIESLDALAASNNFGVMSLFIVLMMISYLVLVTWKQWLKRDKDMFIISMLYSVIGAVVVIVARTKFQWGEPISQRHAMAYVCFLLVALNLVFKNTTLNTKHAWLPFLLMLILFVFRIIDIPQLYQQNDNDKNVLAVAEQIKNDNEDPICHNLEGRFVVSNYSYIYRILCGISVRPFSPTLTADSFTCELSNNIVDISTSRGVIVSIFPHPNVNRENLPIHQALIDNLNSDGWNIFRNNKNGLILMR